MRTSLIETEQIEAHLMRRSTPGDALVFEANLLLNDELNEKLRWQKNAYHKIKIYGRSQLRQEIENAHQTLFSRARHKSFSEKIRQIWF